MNHYNKTWSQVNLFLDWLNLIGDKVLAECYVAYRRYKPIEIILLISVVASFLMLTITVLINTYYVHYTNIISVATFIIIIAELPVTYIACMLRKNFRKSADALMCFTMFIIVVQTSMNCAQIPAMSPMVMKTSSLAHFNQLLHFNQVHWILWTHSHTHLYKILMWCYWKLTYCIGATFAILLISRLSTEAMLFCLANLIAAFIGMSIAYLYPALPAAAIWKHIPLHHADMLDIKGYYDIRHHIMPNFSFATVELPSFHMIWVLNCAISMRHNKYLLSILILYTVSIYAATILLGWHFVADVITGSCIAFISYYIAILINRKLSTRYPSNQYTK